ncbi:tetratricopeptide (TPR) repeat protein [Saccharothrix tamanrassetensis]|uniref:Tetratricopeptide (TPR) repeat protein n=1 Tax=Saccharothrix tamanrassetensis TaxID=1051531 RepID=A0A841CKE9_9PSEU|nr:hypothetical protein [Saccharothrix tamanrassetensis]MBB5958982.1 tetratricopeptide (TPR) repeat protein [Saccharothrix tamanrassetensis]
MAVTKEPNRLLAAVMREAGVSNKGLAARVRELAARDGETIAADHVSVKRWLDGTSPKAATQQYIALALGAKLGRLVKPEDIGFTGGLQPVGTDATADAAEYPVSSSTALDQLGKLTAADLEDQPSLLSATWNPASTSGAITGYLFGDRLQVAAADDPAMHSGATAAAAIRTTAAHLMDLDFKFGGGHVRRMLLFYFKTEIAPLLRQAHPAPVRRELFSAAADVAQLLGWSAYDAGRHAAAQRYFIQGLRLAREAESPVTGARLLSNLSHQANYLGRHSDAVQFARAAQTAAQGLATPAVSSMLLAMEARALASSGEGQEFARVLARAELAFSKFDPANEPEWIRYFTAAELAGEAAHGFRDLGRPAEVRRFADLAVAPDDTPPRTRAFIGMVSAAGALTNGDVDEAAALAIQAIETTGALQSSRYVRYLVDFHRALSESHGRHPLAGQLAEKIIAFYPEVTLGTAVVLSRVA